MPLSLENTLNQKLVNIFNALGLDSKFAFVKVSDRPDLRAIFSVTVLWRWPKARAKTRVKLPV